MDVLVILLIACCGVCYASQCDLAQTCVTDLRDEDCGTGSVVIPNAAVFGCCPGCGTEPTTTEAPGQPGICSSPSSCLSNGKFAPVQCKGDRFTGRCFCFDENGRRIFGQMWRDEADNMACACSRRRSELESSGRQDVTLHCAANGDYEPLQCDDGLCWCAQPKNGQPTVAPVPEDDMSLLPCYTKAIGEQYLRRCESVVVALGKIKSEQSAHGTNFLGSPSTNCDYDGSYGPYQIINGIAYCTGRDGEILGAWSIVSNEMAGMNCNCARDTMIYFPARGLSMTAVCTANGNYRPNQNVGDVYYCVDTDGYQASDLANAWPTDNCASHAVVS